MPKTPKSEQRVLLEQITPAKFLRTVTPSDDNDLPDGPTVIYVGTSGNVTVIAEHDTDPVLLAGASGWQPVRVRRVMASGTAGDDIVAGYESMD